MVLVYKLSELATFEVSAFLYVALVGEGHLARQAHLATCCNPAACFVSNDEGIACLDKRVKDNPSVARSHMRASSGPPSARATS